MKCVIKKNVLDKFMLKNNISRASFADKIGVTQAYITMLLKRNRYPSAQIRNKIMSATNKTWDEIFKIID